MCPNNFLCLSLCLFPSLCLFFSLTRSGILLYLYIVLFIYIYQFSSVAQLCLTIWDPMNCNSPGLPVRHQLPDFTQTHVREMPSNHLILCRPLLLLPSIFSTIGSFQISHVSSSHPVPKVLEFQLQH